MSKFAILKELADLKSLAQRKSSLTRIAVVAILAYFLVGHGRDGLSYLSTASRLVKDKVRSNVPLDFELERARTMVNDLIPDVRKNMLVIAQEEVGVEHLRQEVDQAQVELGKHKDDLVRLRGDMDNVGNTLMIGRRSATPDEVREELARRFQRFQVMEATVSAKEQLLAARERSLSAARLKLDNMLNAKRDLEVQVENLASRLKTQQGHSLASSVEVNDSQLNRCKGLVDELRVRLEVADRLLANTGDIGDLASSSIANNGDIGEQIDRHFAQRQVRAGPTLADAR